MQLSSFSVELNPIKPIQYTTIFGCNIVLLNQNVIFAYVTKLLKLKTPSKMISNQPLCLPLQTTATARPATTSAATVSAFLNLNVATDTSTAGTRQTKPDVLESLACFR